jgi:hypothetical protein
MTIRGCLMERKTFLGIGGVIEEQGRDDGVPVERGRRVDGFSGGKFGLGGRIGAVRGQADLHSDREGKFRGEEDWLGSGGRLASRREGRASRQKGCGP